MKNIGRLLLVLLTACGPTGGDNAFADETGGSGPAILRDARISAAQFDVSYDGNQADFLGSLNEEVNRQEYVDVPYQDTCDRQVPDGYDTRCETRYRDEQKCGYEQVCKNEQQCRNENVCNNERVCKNDRQCRIENRCHSERVCENQNVCTTKPVCTTRQECTNQPVCRDERICEIVNGQRQCRVEKVCQNQQVCRPVQDCRNENVCENRQVCRNENRCTPERICEDVPVCSWEQVCRNDRVCDWRPVCRQEYQCRTESVPYQDCQQYPKYRTEYYSCTKVRRELQDVLDYRHVVDFKIRFEGVALQPGVNDQFKISTLNGQVKFEPVAVVSGLAYYHQVEVKSQVMGPQDRLSTVFVTVRAVEPTAIVQALTVQNLKANARSSEFHRLAFAPPADFGLAVRLRVSRDGSSQPSYLFNRRLTATEMRVQVASGGAELVSVDFQQLGIIKQTSLKGSYTVQMLQSVIPVAPFVWTQGGSVTASAKVQYKVP